MSAEPRAARSRALIGLFLFGSTGTLAELLLMEHLDSVTQWLPIAVLGAGVLAAAFLLADRSLARRTWAPLMAVFIATGLVGIGLHLYGNRAFELEVDPASRGMQLLRETLMGATPAIAPGGLAFLGLLGLLAVRPGSSSRSGTP
ncbi:MAG: hypothetical protein ABFS34_11270 [Gemmatimonadota bacterium]